MLSFQTNPDLGTVSAFDEYAASPPFGDEEPIVTGQIVGSVTMVELDTGAATTNVAAAAELAQVVLKRLADAHAQAKLERDYIETQLQAEAPVEILVPSKLKPISAEVIAWVNTPGFPTQVFFGTKYKVVDNGIPALIVAAIIAGIIGYTLTTDPEITVGFEIAGFEAMTEPLTKFADVLPKLNEPGGATDTLATAAQIAAIAALVFTLTR